MKKNTIINLKGDKVNDITLNETVWGIVPNDSVLYDAITLAQSSQRQGTADTKTRSEVSGGGRKPWRQKGTGNARVGSIRSPIWRGGGITFGPTGNENHEIRMSKTEKRTATKQALSLKTKDICVIDSFDIKDKPMTNKVSKVLDKIAPNKKILVVIDKSDETTSQTFRNIEKVRLITANSLCVANVLDADKILVTKDALALISENLGAKK